MSVSGGRYDAGRGRGARPPESVFVIKTVSGEEGVQLELQQARALRAVLMWLAERRRARPGGALGSVQRRSEEGDGSD